MKLKNKDIIKYEKRKDYKQVLATATVTLEETKNCLYDIYHD